MVELFQDKVFRRVFLFFTVLVGGVWLFLKIISFDQSAYGLDLFSNLQMTYTWLQGFEPLYEGRYGHHSLLHNFYFNMLLAPFTLIFGAYGLFIAHVLITLTACFLTLKMVWLHYPHLKWYTGWWLAVFFVGIYGYWLFENIWYGFHIELLYPSLSLFFAISLLVGKRWQQILAGLLLVLVKEDGAVLACAIHLFYLFIQFSLKKQSAAKAFSKATVVACGWAFVFALGMFWMYYLNHFQSLRTNKAFHYFFTEAKAELLPFVSTCLAQAFDLLIPVFCFIGLFFKWRYLLTVVILVLPLLAVGIISSMLYYPFFDHALAWCPRFAHYYGFLLAAMLMLLVGERFRFILLQPNLKIAYLLCMVLFLFHQKDHLKRIRNYHVFEVAKNRIAEFIKPTANKNRDIVQKISKRVPHAKWVALPSAYYNFFHRHNFMSAESEYIGNGPPGSPDLLILLHNQEQVDTMANYVDFRKYNSDTLADLLIYHKPSMHLNLKGLK